MQGYRSPRSPEPAATGTLLNDESMPFIETRKGSVTIGAS